MSEQDGTFPATPAPGSGDSASDSIKAEVANPDTPNPIQELLGLGIAYVEGGKAHAKFSYPGGYTVNAKNELGEEMEITFNGAIDIDVKPASG